MKKTRKEVTAPQSRGCAKKLGLAERVIALVEEARGKVAKAANVALVYTYYEVGRMIVEDEQGGKKRAAYGKAQLADLSRKLTERFGKGWSPTNLEYMRKFFKVYSVSSYDHRQIPQTDFEESAIDVADSQNGGLEIQRAPITFRLRISGIDPV